MQIPFISAYKFANPEYFWLLIIIPVYLLYYFLFEKKKSASISISTLTPFQDVKSSFPIIFRHLLPFLKMFGVAFIIIALARPQTSSSKQTVKTEGIDIVITIDISISMLAEDFKPNRLEAAKNKAIDFVNARPNDRIGLVIFSGESFTQCPVTIDHEVVKNQIRALKTGLFQDGTAIGSGLATAVARLKDSKAKSKVIILLTDGKNNAGVVSPETASEIAINYNIRVYTIAVGKYGFASFPFQTPHGIVNQQVEVDIDENILKSIASITEGEFFRATNNQSLESIYKKIDKMEKSKVDIAYFNKKTEEYLQFAYIALGFWILELLIRLLIYRFNI